MPNYRCPNPDCEGRKVQTLTVHVAVYRGQLLTCPCLLSDACWKLFFIYVGLVAAVLIVLLWPAVLALESRSPILSRVLAFLLIIGVVCFFYLLFWYYVLPPKIKIEAHRCRRCRYLWAEYGSPISAVSQWAEGEMRRATRRGKKEESAPILATFSSLAVREKKWELAESYARQCLELSQEIKSEKMSAVAHTHLGLVALFRGQYQAAASQFETCLSQYRKSKDSQNIAYSLNNLGLARLYQGATDGVAALFAVSLSYTALIQ